MAKLSVSIVDQHTLKLNEDGKKGDTIDLKSLHTVDESFIIDRIKAKTDEVYQRMLENVIQENETKTKLSLKEQASIFEQTKNELIQEKRELELKMANQQALGEKNISIIEQKLKSEFELERQKLLADIKLIETQTQLKIENQYKEQLNQRLAQIEALKAEQAKLKLEHEVSLNEKLKDLTQAVHVKDKELETLRREWGSRNVKNIGENLENWCYEQYKNVSLFGFKTSTFEKDNVVVRSEGDTKGTKGDYIFKVYNDSNHSILLTSAMVEMKSEALESENKKKNADHYKKLHEDRVKKNLEYAILVSELEYNVESDAPIFVVDQYEKMYVVRPQFFVTLLGIIESIGLKYADIITEKEAERIEFKESLEILEAFEAFKEEILNNSIRHIGTQMENIRKRTETIISSADAIKESTRIVLDTHLNTIKSKIESFSIRKVLNHIDKVNQ